MKLILLDTVLYRIAQEYFSSAQNQISKGKFFKKLYISTNLTNLFEFDVSYAFYRSEKG